MELHQRVEQLEHAVRVAGERAFGAGQRMTDCPHRSHTREAELWRRGFANAQLGAQMTKRP